MARPSTDAAIVADGLALIAAGSTPQEAAERLTAEGRRVSCRTLYRALRSSAEGRARRPSSTPARRAATVPAADSATAEPTSEEIMRADTLMIARRLLGALQARFATATETRAAALAEKICAVIGRIEQIEARRPQPPRPDAVLEELRRLDLEAIAKIEEHLPPAEKVTSLA